MFHTFLTPYFQMYIEKSFPAEVYPLIDQFCAIAQRVRDNNGKMLFAGNGASASLAEHGAVDFTKQGGVRSVTFHDPNLMTCLANDYGYDNWITKAIEFYALPGDVVVLISSSGKSPSVVKAAEYSKSVGLTVVSFTGRDVDNPLKALSDLAFWIDSDAYNLIENTHGIWLTATVDLLIGDAVYETRAYELKHD